jgi:hypothetical protein
MTNENLIPMDHWEVKQLGLNVWFVYRNGECYAPGFTSEIAARADMKRLIEANNEMLTSGPVTVKIVRGDWTGDE